MKYTGTTWRPPFEANSLLLQVTSGCSHNKCRFCSMYKDVGFAVESLDQIEADLREARETYLRVDRVFLVNADPFCLSGKRLKAIAEKIIEILPEVETIGMYASIQNITGKSDEELSELSRLRISGLNVGLESGLPEVLDEMGKGFTLGDAEYQLERLNRAGIPFSVNIIIGGAGQSKYRENAIASARVVNKVRPSLIFIAALHLEHDCPLRDDLIQGRFQENTLGDTIKEELLFLEHLELENTWFFGLHPSNAVPVTGRLQEDKAHMIKKLTEGLVLIAPDDLSTPYTQLVRGNEGAVRFRLNP